MTMNSGDEVAGGLTPRAQKDRMTRAEKFLRTCPQSGDGVHVWIFNAALACADFTQWESDEMIRHIEDATQGCGREVPTAEISRQVRSAIRQVRGSDDGSRKEPGASKGRRSESRWPDPRPDLMVKTQNECSVRTVDDLKGKTQLPSGSISAEMVLDLLFPGNPWLCLGMRSWYFGTRRKSWFLKRGKVAKFQLIVPSSMIQRVGKTAEGKLSEHAKSSVGPRQYLVIEADSGGLDLQASVLWHLDEFLPLVCVVSSRGKSLHGWFRCAGIDEAELRQFYRYARLLGADTAAWGKSQFVRLPGGTRNGEKSHPGNGKIQTVLYFNPENTLQG